MLYFDNASTTPVASEVIDAMMQCLGRDGSFGNPASASYQIGEDAHNIVERSRRMVASELRCEADEVVFTSGATEANNLAIRGLAMAYREKARHLVTCTTEHRSVLEPFRFLERNGFEVTYLNPRGDGVLDPRMVTDALRPDTLLVSLMHTNNETGVFQDLTAIGQVLNDAGVFFHVDAAQAAGKFAIDLGDTPIDLLSLSAHKFYGPKGAGCLVARNRRRLRLEPVALGGGQEFGLRSGTVATHQVVGLAEALRFAASRRSDDLIHVAELKMLFLRLLRLQFPIVVHGDLQHASPYIVNFSIPGVRSDWLINQLSHNVAISSGSACSSGAIEPSYVLKAMGIVGDALNGAVRVSFNRCHTRSEVETAVRQIVSAVRRMHELD